MKAIRLFTSLFAVMALSLGFTACSDDDTLEVNEANIVEKWNYVYASGYDKGPGIAPEDEAWEETFDYGSVTLDIKADHTVDVVSTVENEFVQNATGSWKLVGNVLTFTLNLDGDETTSTMTIKSLSKNSLEMEGYEGEGQYESYISVTLKK